MENTLDELLKNGWHYIDDKYLHLICACLNYLEQEMDRLYWNKNQKRMVSPFSNTGEVFESDRLIVRAYSWNEENDQLPNLDTKNLKVWWYKHSNRGVNAMVKCSDEELADMLSDMLTTSLASMKKKINGESED